MYCGGPAGYSGVCKACTPKAEAQRKQEEEATTKRALLEQGEQFDKHVDELVSRLSNGEPVYLHISVDVEVKSYIDGCPLNQENFALVTEMGLQGWELVALVPRTNGVTLTNRALGLGTESWAGGIGGNVVGAHAIMKKSYTGSPRDMEMFKADVKKALQLR